MVLTYTVVRVHPEGTMDYIANPEKIIPGKTSEDIQRVLNYMGDGSAERVYTFGHHCSANPKLAQRQFEMCRQRYFDYKDGAGVQGCTDDKKEVLALHFFLSYDKKDPVTEEKMNDISRRLDEYIGNFPCLSANHWDRDHKHTHKLVGQYSVSGKPHKFAMKSKDLADMRRFANRLCYEHGLSIIDLPELRKYDKEYSHWLDGVIAEGKVRVLPANGAGKEHKGKSHSSRYYQWLEAQKRWAAEEERRLTDAQLRQKRVDEKYFYRVDGTSYRSSSDRKTYASIRFDSNGRMRSNAELLCILLYCICKNEFAYAHGSTDEVARYKCDIIKAKHDKRLQAMYDSIAIAQQYQVSSPQAVSDRLKDTGKQMNALRTEKAKHDTRTKTGKELADALGAYNHFRAQVEGVDTPDANAKEIYNTAYSIMAAHRCTTQAQIDDFWARYNFSIKKSKEYEERMADLRKQYRDLKKLEAVCNERRVYIDEAYALSGEVVPGRKITTDDKIKIAKSVSECETVRESHEITLE